MTDHDYDYFDPDIYDDAECFFCHTDCVEDVDCESCGLKFWIRSCSYGTGEGKKPWPHKCPRCEKGLPPLYEY